MKNKHLPPLSELHRLFDPETGSLTWRWREDVGRSWNTRYAGKVAGCLNAKGYRQISIHGTPYKAHRIAWSLANNTLVLPHQEIDHKNTKRDDNKASNLRLATSNGNNCNCSVELPRIPGSEHLPRGVDRHQGKFRARVDVDGREQHLGYFKDPWQAGLVAAEAREKLHGEFCNHGEWAPSRLQWILQVTEMYGQAE